MAKKYHIVLWNTRVPLDILTSQEMRASPAWQQRAIVAYFLNTSAQHSAVFIYPKRILLILAKHILLIYTEHILLM
jgi:hypothetical protein